MLRPVRDLVNFSGRNPTVFVKESMVLSDFVKTLTTGSNHRALILDEFEDSEINASPSMEHIKDIIRFARWMIPAAYCVEATC